MKEALSLILSYCPKNSYDIKKIIYLISLVILYVNIWFIQDTKFAEFSWYIDNHIIMTNVNNVIMRRITVQ